MTSMQQHFFPATKPRTNRYPFSLYTPFGHGVEYKTQDVDPNHWHNDLYMGEPSDKSERAWNKLIHRKDTSAFTNVNQAD
ncbi:MAG: hypothetical protein Q9201_000951 [Fulgogasparrea decipioides]